MTRFVGNLRFRPRIAAVCPNDEATLLALQKAVTDGLADAILVTAEHSDTAAISDLPTDHVHFIQTNTPAEAAACAVALAHAGKADVLMKGLIGTDMLLHAVLDKQKGLLPAGHVLTHVAAAEIPAYDKLLFFTDAAVIPYPTQQQREAQVGEAIAVCRSLGIARPHVALVHCSEKASEKFPHTEGYATLKALAATGHWGDAVVDGPLDVRTACDAEACRVKGIDTPIKGAADVLVFPDIEAGNAFYKAITRFAGARVAGILRGTTHPIVVTSRGDNAESKFDSLLMALALAATATNQPNHPVSCKS